MAAKSSKKDTKKDSIRKKFKRLQGPIEKSLKSSLEKAIPEKLSAAIQTKVKATQTTIQSAMHSGKASDLSNKISAKVNEKLGESAELAKLARNVASQTAVQSAHLATETAHIAVERVQAVAGVARERLDQILVGLEHRGINLKESGDVVQKIGLKVLQRADEIRSQIAKQPMAPEWLKSLADQKVGAQSAEPSAKVEAAAPNESNTESGSASGIDSGQKAEHFDSAESVDENGDDGIDIDAAPSKKKGTVKKSSRSSKGAGATVRSTVK